jgi:hypothetical protein
LKPLSVYDEAIIEDLPPMLDLKKINSTNIAEKKAKFSMPAIFQKLLPSNKTSVGTTS